MYTLKNISKNISSLKSSIKNNLTNFKLDPYKHTDQVMTCNVTSNTYFDKNIYKEDIHLVKFNVSDKKCKDAMFKKIVGYNKEVSKKGLINELQLEFMDGSCESTRSLVMHRALGFKHEEKLLLASLTSKSKSFWAPLNEYNGKNTLEQVNVVLLENKWANKYNIPEIKYANTKLSYTSKILYAFDLKSDESLEKNNYVTIINPSNPLFKEYYNENNNIKDLLLDSHKDQVVGFYKEMLDNSQKPIYLNWFDLSRLYKVVEYNYKTGKITLEQFNKFLIFYEECKQDLAAELLKYGVEL